MQTKAYIHTKYEGTKTLQTFLSFGRGEDSQIMIKNEQANFRHARIELCNGKYIIRDLKTQLGTYVNGTKVIEAFLNEGDQISIAGEDFMFSTQSPTIQSRTLVSKNDKWMQQLSLLPNLSKTDFPVLLLGSSGTGKELIAEEIHQLSLRAQGPFVRVNCSALTETLVESELFGHVKGSFTGAYQDRKGAFESARNGTLFLDEIGDLPYSMQAKLLRALENNEIRPVGSDRTIKTNVRVVAATHQNLSVKVNEKSFREDLYYRLNVLSITPPALKERMEDFEDLIFNFAKTFKVCVKHEAILKLKSHKWPGNIRELKNLIARASALFPGKEITAEDAALLLTNGTPDSYLIHQQQSPTKHLSVIKEIEKEMIIKRLVHNKGNQKQTAQDLGMPKSTLHDRIKLYQIDTKKYYF